MPIIRPTELSPDLLQESFDITLQTIREPYFQTRVQQFLSSAPRKRQVSEKPIRLLGIAQSGELFDLSHRRDAVFTLRIGYLASQRAVATANLSPIWGLEPWDEAYQRDFVRLREGVPMHLEAAAVPRGGSPADMSKALRGRDADFYLGEVDKPHKQYPVEGRIGTLPIFDLPMMLRFSECGPPPTETNS